jgi:hypothetical protein
MNEPQPQQVQPMQQSQQTQQNVNTENIEKKPFDMKKEKMMRDDDVSSTLNKVVYWGALLVAIVGNLIVSVVLIPFLLVLSKIQLYMIIVVIGMAFGALFNMLLKDIEEMDRKHHVIAGIFIPALAIINVFIMTRLANYLTIIIGVNNVPHNPIVISIIYVTSFSFPYIISKVSHREPKEKPPEKIFDI